MKTKSIFLALFALLTVGFAQASGTNLPDEKLSLAQYLLQHQSTTEHLKGQTHFGFMLDNTSTLGYSLKNAGGETVHVYIQQTTQRVFFVEFYETVLSAKDLQQHLSTLNYVWVGSEKGCEYLNNGTLALTLCPQSGKGTRVCVNLMPH